MPIKPYRGSSRDRLTAIINAQNPTPRTEGVDFEYGPVEVWSGPLDSNTRVILTPIVPDVYIGPVPITYKRLPINALLQLPPTERRDLVIAEFPFNTHGILAEINDAYGLDLTTAEVVNLPYDTDVPFVTLQIQTGNYAWLPSSVQLPATYIYDIADYIPDPLGGFQNPELGELEEIIGDPLDGFDNTPLVELSDVISNPLGGFDNPAETDLEDVIYGTSLGGFDNPAYLPTLGFAPLVNAFHNFQNDLFVAPTLDGFYYSTDEV